MRVYLDSAPIIYLVEDVVPYVSALEARLIVPGTMQVCSELRKKAIRFSGGVPGSTASAVEVMYLNPRTASVIRRVASITSSSVPLPVFSRPLPRSGWTSKSGLDHFDTFCRSTIIPLEQC